MKHILKGLFLSLMSAVCWGETYLCDEASSGIDWQYIRSGDGFSDEHTDRFEIILSQTTTFNLIWLALCLIADRRSRRFTSTKRLIIFF